MPNIGHGFTTGSHTTSTGLQEESDHIRPDEESNNDPGFQEKAVFGVQP